MKEVHDVEYAILGHGLWHGSGFIMINGAGNGIIYDIECFKHMFNACAMLFKMPSS